MERSDSLQSGWRRFYERLNKYGGGSAITQCSFIALLFMLLFSCSKRPSFEVDEFEGESYGKWQANGVAFGSGPVSSNDGANVRGVRGMKAASSLHDGESARGTLLSAKFKIERRYINFLIGGGDLPDSTGLQILIDDNIVFKSTGNNQDSLVWMAADLRDYPGKFAQIMIFDFAAGKRGYIIVDHIMQSDVSALKAKPYLKREMVVEKNYLLIPVRRGLQIRVLKISAGDMPVRRFDVALAERDSAESWVFTDLSMYKGKTVTLEADQFWDSGAGGLEVLIQSDSTGDAIPYP